MAILTRAAILEQVRAGRISISDFDERQLNDTGYDLRLGGEFLTYVGYDRSRPKVLDSRLDNPVHKEKPCDVGTRVLIDPHRLVLCHTRELVTTDHFQPSIEGKSSIARLGVQVHLTAGWGEPGFNGQWTLEVLTGAHPVYLYVGMRIAQVKFDTLEGEPSLYAGNYVGERAVGPVPSRSWKQFEDDAWWWDKEKLK